jgi:ABC-type uncharacterized transport system ATPase subunit
VQPEVSFDGVRALNTLSLVLEAGEMRAAIGPNGAGKATRPEELDEADVRRRLSA